MLLNMNNLQKMLSCDLIYLIVVIPVNQFLLLVHYQTKVVAACADEERRVVENTHTQLFFLVMNRSWLNPSLSLIREKNWIVYWTILS